MTYKTEVQTMYKKIAQQMRIQAPPIKIGGGNDKLNATAGFKKIKMTKGLAKLVNEEPKLVESLIAHELTHYKNRDPQTKFKNLYRSFAKKFYAYNLMFELRASIGGYTYSGMKTESDIWEIEMKFKDPKYHDKNRSAYLVGYPTSKQIAFFASRNDKLTEEIAKEILEDYCNVLNIKNRENFIIDVLKVAKV